MSRNPHPMKRVMRAYDGQFIAKGHVRFECQGQDCRWFVEAWKNPEGVSAMTTAAAAIAEHKAERFAAIRSLSTNNPTIPISGSSGSDRENTIKEESK